jgi:FkbM family methyltransferase
MKDVLLSFAESRGEVAPPIDLLLIVGAGPGNDLAAWQALAPKRIVLCEPSGKSFDALAHKFDTAGFTDTTLIEKAIVAQSSHDGTAPLFSNRVANEASLYEPSDFFKRYWPNAGASQECRVQGLPIQELMQQVRPDAKSCNALVIDAPGAELALIQALGREQLLMFSACFVRTSEQSLYESGSCLSELRRCLPTWGFKLSAQKESELTPHVSLQFEKDTLAIELEELRAQVAALEERLRASESGREVVEGEKRELEERLRASESGREVVEGEKRELEERLRASESGRSEDQKERDTCKAKCEELESRQSLFNEELAKAEGQIELIKDLLLRENNGL